MEGAEDWDKPSTCPVCGSAICDGAEDAGRSCIVELEDIAEDDVKDGDLQEQQETTNNTYVAIWSEAEAEAARSKKPRRVRAPDPPRPEPPRTTIPPADLLFLELQFSDSAPTSRAVTNFAVNGLHVVGEIIAPDTRDGRYWYRCFFSDWGRTRTTHSRREAQEAIVTEVSTRFRRQEFEGPLGFELRKQTMKGVLSGVMFKVTGGV